MTTETIKKQYEKLKNEFGKITNSMTMKRFLILAQAQKIAKKIYGKSFSIRKLAKDFDLSPTYTFELLSLNKMTKTSTKLLRENKISAAKMSLICATTEVANQDEFTQFVIKDELTYDDISHLKHRTKEEIEKARLQKAIANGFASKLTSTRSLLSMIKKLKMLLKLDITDFQDKSKPQIFKELEKLQISIQHFLDNNK